MPSTAVLTNREDGEHAYVVLINPLRKGKINHSVSMWCTEAPNLKFYYLPMNESPPRVSHSIVCVASNSLELANHIRQQLISAWKVPPNRVIHCPWVADKTRPGAASTYLSQRTPESANDSSRRSLYFNTSVSPVPNEVSLEDSSEDSFSEDDDQTVRQIIYNKPNGLMQQVVLNMPWVKNRNYAGLYTKQPDEVRFVGENGAITQNENGVWVLWETTAEGRVRMGPIMSSLGRVGPLINVTSWEWSPAYKPAEGLQTVTVAEKKTHELHVRYRALLAPVVTVFCEEDNENMARYGGIFVLTNDINNEGGRPRYKKPGKNEFLEYHRSGHWCIMQDKDSDAGNPVWCIRSNALTADKLRTSKAKWQYWKREKWHTATDMQVYDPEYPPFTPYRSQALLEQVATFFGQGTKYPGLPEDVRAYLREEGRNEDRATFLASLSVPYGMDFGSTRVAFLENIRSQYFAYAEQEMGTLTLFHNSEKPALGMYENDLRARIKHFGRQNEFPFVFLLRGEGPTRLRGSYANPGGRSSRRLKPDARRLAIFRAARAEREARKVAASNATTGPRSASTAAGRSTPRSRSASSGSPASPSSIRADRSASRRSPASRRPPPTFRSASPPSRSPGQRGGSPASRSSSSRSINRRSSPPQLGGSPASPRSPSTEDLIAASGALFAQFKASKAIEVGLSLLTKINRQGKANRAPMQLTSLKTYITTNVPGVQIKFADKKEALNYILKDTPDIQAAIQWLTTEGPYLTGLAGKVKDAKERCQKYANEALGMLQSSLVGESVSPRGGPVDI